MSGSGSQGAQVTELNSGIRVVTEAVPSVRSVALGLWVRTGSRDETPAQAGVSHFLEHLLFKGVRGAVQARCLVPRADRDEDTQGIGAGGPDVLSDDLEAVCQHRTADGAIQLGKAPSRTTARNRHLR